MIDLPFRLFVLARGGYSPVKQRLNNCCGTMFQNLMYYKEQSFYEEHPTARLCTPDGTYTVEFFAGYVADVDSDAWKLDFTSDRDFADWLAAALERSLFESTVPPTATDKIVTLSTCSYEFYNVRFVLHGIIEPQISN